MRILFQADSEHLFICCWSAFQAGHASLRSKTFMEGSKGWGCLCAPCTKSAVMPLALSPKDSYKREVLQRKMWRLTPGENQGMGRKPSRRAEQREVHFLGLGAAISRRACSTAKSAPTQLTKHVPGFPGTNNPTIYCISPIPHHLSNICQTDSRGLLPLPSRQRQLIHQEAYGISWQLLFLHKSLGSELLWLCCSFSR